MKNLIQEFPEDFNKNTYMASLGKSLRYLFNQQQRYFNIDLFKTKVSSNKNINMISLFDCCREKPPTKGMNDLTEEDTEAHGM